jgi:hypothetical protein
MTVNKLPQAPMTSLLITLQNFKWFLVIDKNTGIATYGGDDTSICSLIEETPSKCCRLQISNS